MPEAVKDALIFCFEKEGRMSAEDAAKFFAKLEQSGRFQSETWS